MPRHADTAARRVPRAPTPLRLGDCANCGHDLGDASSCAVRFDQWGNAYCDRSCQREAAQLLTVDDSGQLAAA